MVPECFWNDRYHCFDDGGYRSGNPWAIGSFAVYAVCMTLSYVTSTFSCFDPCTTGKTLAAVRSWCLIIAYCGNLYALYIAEPPARRLLGLVTIRCHMDRGSDRCLAEFQEDERKTI